MNNSIDIDQVRTDIEEGRAVLGVEFGSTRIKAVLIGDGNMPIASGGHEWASKHVDGVWTYDLDAVWNGLSSAYADLASNVAQRYGVVLRRLRALGVSGMMHGYLPFDEDGELLTNFRTWQNTITGESSRELTRLFNYNIPQRWSIAHLHHAVLGNERHASRISHLTTLAGYVHWRLSGVQVLGVGEASGMFPIELGTGSFNERMIAQFDEVLAHRDYGWQLADILPEVRLAGAEAGSLSPEGARLLDPNGALEPGTPMCPPEGDASTGMVATNSVSPRTANVSAGTSIFAMVVLENELAAVHEEIDLVTTPSGDLVGMAHCNNGTVDLNAWVSLFGEVAELFGKAVDMETLFATLYRSALDGDADGGGMLAYNYLAGEHLTGMDSGRPLFTRSSSSNFTLANFMRTHLYASLGALRVGLDVLKEEGVELDTMFAHGGLFRTPGVAQRFLAASINAPVSVGEVAAEGGSWGMALLASYMLDGGGQQLGDYLQDHVFADAKMNTVHPDPNDVAGFDQFMARYRAGLPIERAAIETL